MTFSISGNTDELPIVKNFLYWPIGAYAVVAWKIMEGAIHSATNAGYDCLCEGMLTLPKHGPFIDRLRMSRFGFTLLVCRP